MSIAKIKDYGIGKTKAGLPQVVIEFEAEAGEIVKWYGSLKEGKARQITIDTLVKVCDFNGNDLKQMAAGIPGGAINHLKDYDITIEEVENENGKKYSKVAWVNLPGSGKFKKLDDGEAVDILAGYDFKNDLAVARAEKPKSAPLSAAAQDDIGF